MGAGSRSSFGAMLRRYRLGAGLTQATLAARAGLSERAINDLERDPQRTPRLETVTLLAEALGLSAGDRAQLLAEARPETQVAEHPLVATTSGQAARQDSVVTSESVAPSAHPAAVTLSPSGRLLVAPNPFVGRAHDVAAVCARLREPGVRLLTLTGPGGIGKTRLALQVMTELQGAFADGAYFADLGSLTDPALVLPTIAAALGIPEFTQQSPTLRLIEALQTRELLLALDNFEQVAAAASDVELLLSTCPTLTILVTSRVVLHLAREHEFPVSPLAIPDPANELSEPSDLMAYDAVALFAQRARAVLPDFTLTAGNARVVADICVRLEGVPLAIELAAARIKLLPLSTLLVRLDQQLAVLTGGPQDAPERQRTVRATLDWSCSLLTPEQQTLFRRLAVFVGGWTLEAAEGICADTPSDARAGSDPRTEVRDSAILDLLGSLVDHSLVLVQRRDGTVRYGLLETVRQYALEALHRTGDERDLRDRHLEWFLWLAEDIESQTWIMPFPAALSALQAEEDNFRAALDWSKQRDASGQTTLRLAGALTIFWQAVGAVNEGRGVLRDALARADPAARTSAWARALMAAGDLASLQTDPAGASPQLEDALAIFQELGDERNLARTLTVAARVWHWTGDDQRAFTGAREKALSICRKLGDLRALCETLWLWADLTLDHGDYVTARRQLEECLSACRRLNDPLMLTCPLISLARVACAEGDTTQARALAEEAVTLRSGTPRWLLAIALNSLGEVERCAERHERANDLFTQALAIFRAQNDRAGIAWSLHNLGHVALRRGDAHRAAELFAEALAARHEHGYSPGIASGLVGMAGVCCLAGEYERAARLFGASDSLLEISQSVLAPADKLAYDQDAAIVRANLEPSTLDEVWAAGYACPLERIIAEALDGRVGA